jgi:hypothetical protein
VCAACADNLGNDSARGESAQNRAGAIAAPTKADCSTDSPVRLDGHSESIVLCLDRGGKARDTYGMDSKQDQEEAGNPPVTCQAVLLCESVIRDELTKNTTIVGVFNTFYVAMFPGTTVACTLYLRLQRLVGVRTVAVEVRDEEPGRALFQNVGVADFGNPPEKEPSELRMPIAPMRFERPGAFEMVALIDDQEFGRVRFHVRLPPTTDQQ